MLTEKRYKISLTTKEPFRVGGKEDPLTGVHNPVAKVGGKIVIPGPSLKGALRAQIESYLIDKYYHPASNSWPEAKKPFQPCIPCDQRLISPDERKLIGRYKDGIGACHYPCTERKCRSYQHSICPACYLLGSQGINGFVRVPFLSAETTTSELYSASIDRATGTVKEGANWPYELIPDGTEFTGELVVLLEDSLRGCKLGEPRPLSDRTSGDLWLKDNKGKADEAFQSEFIKTYILERLKAVTILGGYKSKGFGEVEIRVEETAE